jgi:hypothetical protein
VCNSPLSKEYIVEAANKYAKNVISITEYTCLLDEGNKQWMAAASQSDSSLVRETMMILNCRDFQSVLYTRPNAELGGRFWVFVDRCSGKIITSYGER